MDEYDELDFDVRDDETGRTYTTDVEEAFWTAITAYGDGYITCWYKGMEVEHWTYDEIREDLGHLRTQEQLHEWLYLPSTLEDIRMLKGEARWGRARFGTP